MTFPKLAKTKNITEILPKFQQYLWGFNRLFQLECADARGCVDKHELGSKLIRNWQAGWLFFRPDWAVGQVVKTEKMGKI